MLNICFNESQHIYAYKRCAYIKKDYQDKQFSCFLIATLLHLIVAEGGQVGSQVNY